MMNLSAGKDFHGSIAEAQNKDDVLYNSGKQMNPVEDDQIVVGGEGRGRGLVDASGKPWQQERDWACLNTRCGNVNLGFRAVCNHCKSARPSGVPDRSSGGGGRGRGRGADDSGGRGAAGLSGPNDGACPMANPIERRNPSNGSVYACNLPAGTDENMLEQHDKRTGWRGISDDLGGRGRPAGACPL